MDRAAQSSAIGGTSWFCEMRPVLRFVAIVVVIMILYYGAMATSVVRTDLFPAYLRVNAEVSASVIRFLGRDAVARNVAITSPAFSLSIAKGCDAIQPSVLMGAGVVALQVPLLVKIPGLLVGACALLTINLVRIVSLFYIGIHFPSIFHVMHVDVWQVAFVLLAIAFWAIWAVWATGRVAQRAPDT